MNAIHYSLKVQLQIYLGGRDSYFNKHFDHFNIHLLPIPLRRT